MKKLWIIIYCFSVLALLFIAQLDPSKTDQNTTIQTIAVFVEPYKIWIIIIAGCIIFLYTLWPKWLKPHKEKKKFIGKLLTRINLELFSGNENDHRITLFKEIPYIRAFLRNGWHALYHLRYRGKRTLYWKPPKLGRYLIVNSRCGRRLKKIVHYVPS